MAADINCDKILVDAIHYLEHGLEDESLLEKKIKLLLFFAQEMIDGNDLDVQSDAWLEKLAFEFALKYLDNISYSESKLFYKECYQLITLCSKKKHLSIQLLKKCLYWIDYDRNNFKLTDAVMGENSQYLPLEFVVRVVQDVCNSVSNESTDVELVALKQDIITSVITHMKSEDVTESCFINICGLLKSLLLASHTRKDIELIWATITHLFNKGKYEWLMLLISILLQVISSSFIIKKTSFWVILQKGLVFPDPLTTKRALFIIKWLLDYISKEDEFSVDSDGADNGVVISWSKGRSEETWNIWKTLILLIETLDEKQMHVISPVLPSVNDVSSACRTPPDGNPILHFSWLLVILRKSLSHESKLLNKWALHYCLQTSLEEYLVCSVEGLQFIFIDLMKALQAIFIYNKEEENSWGTPPLVLNMLTCFLSNCLKHAGSGQPNQFVNMVLDSFVNSSFNNISLVYLSEVLSHQTISSALSTTEVSKFKQFCFSKIRIYRIEYQKVIFHNLSVFYTKNALPDQDIVLEIINLLSYAIDKGFFVFNGNCWQVWLKWLKKMPNASGNDMLIKKIQDFSLNHCKSEDSDDGLSDATGFSITVMFQIGICPPKDIRILLYGLSAVMEKLHSNPYLTNQKVIKALKFTNALFKAALKFDASVVSKLFTFLVSSLPNILQHIIYTSQNLNENKESYEILSECLILLQNYTMLSEEYGRMIVVELKKFFAKIYDNILMRDLNNILHVFVNARDDDGYVILLDKLFAPRLLKCYLEWKDASIEDPEMLYVLLVNLLIKCNRKYLNTVCKKSEVTKYVNCDSFISDIWCSLRSLLDKQMLVCNGNMEKKELLLETFYSDITIVSHENILHVTRFASCFIPMFKYDNDVIVPLVDNTWKVIKDQSQTDHSFWKIYMSCIKCIFNEQLLLSSDPIIVDKLKEIWGNILVEGENRFHIVSIFISHCVQIWNKHADISSTLQNYINELISTAIFGPLMNKCLKPMNDLIYYLHNSGIYDEIDGLRSAHFAIEETRLIVINFLLNLKNGSSISIFFNKLKSELLSMALKLSGSKRGYYLNTLIHRKVLRLWQLFLILLTKFPSSFDVKTILPKLYSAIKTAHQTSIRYLIEWCILLIFHSNNQLVETLMYEMEEASEKQVLSITSMMSLCIHLANLLQGEHFEMFVRRVVSKILPWSHAQHLTSRLHAQVALENIWENIVKNKHTKLEEEFRFLSYCFSLKVDNTTAVRHRKELKEQFFYDQFHPIEHYSLEMIFHKFPAHCDILDDEWILVDRFVYHEEVSVKSVTLRVHDVVTVAMPSKSDENELEKESNLNDEKLIDIQKKIMPWRVVPPTEDVILQSELQNKKDSISSQLILCAVLVDKIPNLGGLCRTSEIFGVGSLIIGSHNYVKDQGFKSLSVSAERWLNIEQVLPVKLASYLKEMRNDGYHLVGVEQTANSKKIGQYKFPKKTVLLLGNEKTGIPVDLIQLLDDCVEIPQVGIIRSLNVHISGAIMIWEYCKQHVLEMSGS